MGYPSSGVQSTAGDGNVMFMSFKSLLQLIVFFTILETVMSDRQDIAIRLNDSPKNNTKIANILYNNKEYKYLDT